MTFPLALSAVLQAAYAGVESTPTGLEWMTIASVVVPAVVLVAIIAFGQQRTV